MKEAIKLRPEFTNRRLPFRIMEEKTIVVVVLVVLVVDAVAVLENKTEFCSKTSTDKD